VVEVEVAMMVTIDVVWLMVAVGSTVGIYIAKDLRTTLLRLGV
jgi:hypothetical protein